MQAQIAFDKNNPSSILNLKVGSQRYKKILCNHLQFVKYFVIFYTLSLRSDSHFPWMVLLPDEVLWSHLALPEKLRWSRSYNLGSVISMSTKSDPKYASFEFSSLQNKGVLSKDSTILKTTVITRRNSYSRPSPNFAKYQLSSPPKPMTLPGEEGAREARTLLFSCYSMLATYRSSRTGRCGGETRVKHHIKTLTQRVDQLTETYNNLT